MSENFHESSSSNSLRIETPRTTKGKMLPRLSKMRLLNRSSFVSSKSDRDATGGKSDASSISDFGIDEFDLDKPDDYGLMISVENGKCEFQFCLDHNFKAIDPDCYAPECLNEMRHLAGGGSGVAVFAGIHPKLGKIVMKHGGFADLEELFALATIEAELSNRAKELNAQQSAVEMSRCLPEFKMIYISPNHIIDMESKFVEHRISLVEHWTLKGLPERHSDVQERVSTIENIVEENDIPQMSIQLFEAHLDILAFELDRSKRKQKLAVILPHEKTESLDLKTARIDWDSYGLLQGVVDELAPLMAENTFKFTLAQKAIGGENTKTGNQWLYEGKLHGPVLENLISKFIKTIHHLQSLTLPREVDAVEVVRREIQLFEANPRMQADEISDLVDRFTGNAIKKNFHPEKGRQLYLRTICKKFRDEDVFLIEEEKLPAKHLGRLLRAQALMSDVFQDAPDEPLRINPEGQYWKNILRQAVDGRDSMSSSALTQIWTCGLADAGIHNLFVGEDELYLFDLGEPQLQSLPAFFTKFLFSFFHTLGMEEDKSGKSWVRRFDIVGNKLKITKETQELLPKAYDAFSVSLDRIIDDVLDCDQTLRFLLLQYVTLQLLSDASFCIQKWDYARGGIDSTDQSSDPKWLWRALWDVYVAFDVNSKESWERFRVVQREDRASLLEGRVSYYKMKSFMIQGTNGFNMKSRFFNNDLLDASLQSYLQSSEEENSDEEEEEEEEEKEAEDR